MQYRLTLTVCLLTAFAAERADAQSYGRAPRPGKLGTDSEFALRVDQKLGASIPLDAQFHDHNGKEVTLGELVGGKPTILVPAYYRCPKLCNEVLNGLLSGMRKMREQDSTFTAGEAYNVITFSIDAREAPALANTKRAHYLREYDGREPNVPGWWFLTASKGQGTNVAEAEKTIHEVTESIGYPFVVKYRGAEYQYQKNPETGEGTWRDQAGKAMKMDRSSFGHSDDYFHPAAVIILTPEGKISRYLLDVGFEPRTLRLALVEASGGKVGTKVDQIALLCSSYDETTGHYKPAMIILAVVAAPFAFLVLGIAGYAWRKSRREKNSTELPPLGATEPPSAT